MPSVLKIALRIVLPACIGLALICTPVAAAPPRVVASIKPVHSLVAGVMAGVATPDLLVSGSASVHTYSLKPSDAARLEAADVVFWIGPAFENFLVKPLALSTAKTVALLDAPGLTVSESHDADETVDGHVWLDPANAKAMIAAIVQTLRERDPANANTYVHNAQVLTARIDQLDGDLARELAPAKGKPFVVFHNAYGYFQRRYGLNGVAAITVTPDRLPGARHVANVKDMIARQGVVCVFAEPPFEPVLVHTLVEGTSARQDMLDPEGIGLAPGPELYFTLMHDLADNMARCLGGS